MVQSRTEGETSAETRFCLRDACFLCQPAHNDKTAHPEVSRLMTELIKSRKKLKGQRHVGSNKQNTINTEHF